MGKKAKKGRNRVRAIPKLYSVVPWVSGSVLLVFVIVVFFFAPNALPEFKRRILAVLSALLAGLFAFFLTGRIQLSRSDERKGGMRIRASGGMALFLIVLYWWYSPLAPLKAGPPSSWLYTVRVTVLGLGEVPINGTEAHASIGGEWKRVAGGWELAVPQANRPADGKVSIYVSKSAEALGGRGDIILGKERTVTLEIQLLRDDSALVRGVVYDDDTDKPVGGATVHIVGYEGEALVTSVNGSFTLHAHTADGQRVLIRAEKGEYQPKSKWHLAGSEPATIYLMKRR